MMKPETIVSTSSSSPTTRRAARGRPTSSSVSRRAASRADASAASIDAARQGDLARVGGQVVAALGEQQVGLVAAVVEDQRAPPRAGPARGISRGPARAGPPRAASRQRRPRRAAARGAGEGARCGGSRDRVYAGPPGTPSPASATVGAVSTADPDGRWWGDLVDRSRRRARRRRGAGRPRAARACAPWSRRSGGAATWPPSRARVPLPRRRPVGRGRRAPGRARPRRPACSGRHVETLVDADALRELARAIGRLLALGGDPTAVSETLETVAARALELAAWRDEPLRALASLPALDEGALAPARAPGRGLRALLRASEPLVAVQDTLTPELIAALREVEEGAGAGAGERLADRLAGAMPECEDLQASGEAARVLDTRSTFFRSRSASAAASSARWRRASASTT